MMKSQDDTVNTLKYYAGIDLGGTGIKCGIVNENGKIIAVSYSRYGATNDEISVIIINAKSTRVRESLRYAEHWMKSYEWLFDRMVYQDTPNDLLKEGKGICIYKSNVSW